MSMLRRPLNGAQAVVDSRIMRVGVRLSQEYLESEQARNRAVWSDKRHWFLGFYFGRGDSRLWVPRKVKGQPHESDLVINFGHPRGRQAGKILALAYLICTTGAVIVGAIALGYRW